MTRLATFAAAVAFLAAPAIAGTYSAKPAAVPAEKRIIARDISWACGPEACRGSTELSRPVVLCQGLARRAGRIESFTADGRALGDADLAKCNSVAKAGGAPALATAK
jgi:hypothetical protein